MTGAGQTWVTDENGAVVPGSVVEGGSNEAALASALAATQETLQSVRKELLLTETRLVEARTEEDARAEKIEATRTKPLEGTYGLKKRRGSGRGSGGGHGGGKVGGIGRGSDTLEAHAEDLVTRLQQVERVVEDQALALVELRQREVRSGIEHRVKIGEVRRHKRATFSPHPSVFVHCTCPDRKRPSSHVSPSLPSPLLPTSLRHAQAHELLLQRQERIACLEHELRCRRENGAVKLRSKDATIRSLSHRSGLHAELGARGQEVEQMRVESNHLHRAVEDLTRQRDAARGQSTELTRRLEGLREAADRETMAKTVRRREKERERRESAMPCVLRRWRRR